MSTSSRKNFKDMTMLELKEYLQARGVTVTGYLKSSLVQIANAVQTMMLPVGPNFECQSDDKKLIIHDMEIEDPFTISHDAIDYFNDSPPFGLYDIFNHLIYHTTDYDKQGLAAYRSFDDYRLFEEGYVESLRTKTLTGEGVHLYFAKVRPAMKEKTDAGKKFYELWFILEGRGPNRGSVLKAKCHCKGGQDGGCKHIAAAMYSLEETLNTRGEDSVTSAQCKWVKRPTASSKPCEIKELFIGKRNSPSKRKNVEETSEQVNTSKKANVQYKKRKRYHVYCENIEVDVRNEEDRNPPCLQSCLKFVQALSADNHCTTKPVHGTGKPVHGTGKPVLLPLLEKIYLPSDGKETIHRSASKETDSGSNVNKKEVRCDWRSESKENCTTNAKKSEESSAGNLKDGHGIMKKKLHDLLNKNNTDVERVASDIRNGELFFTEKEIECTSSNTLKQWRCKEWFIQKAGFISASKAKRIHAIQTSLEQGKNRKVSNIVLDIVHPIIPSYTPCLPKQPQNARDWGLKHEESARQAYYRVEKKQHYDLKLHSKGFLISSRKPFLGASVDNVRTCSCKDCHSVVVEYKCPWKHKEKPPKEAFLTPEVGGEQVGDTFLLKSTSKYYYQVQLQMFVCSLMLCHLVVWTKLGVFVVKVPFNEEFINSVIVKLEEFWISHILPSMMLVINGLDRTTGKTCIVYNLLCI